MKTVQYALILRSESGERLAVVGSPHEALTKHGKMAPAMSCPCLQLLKRPGAARVDIIKWKRGMDLDAAPALLIVSPSPEHPGWLSYQVVREQDHGEEDDAKFRACKDLGSRAQSEAEDLARV